MIVQAVKWIGGIDGCLELIDQRKLPAELVKLKCGDTHQLFEAIKTLAVRGAPAIGVAAAYGPVLALQKLEPADSLQQGLKAISKSCEYLKSSRPTAVNLSWAADRIQRSAEKFAAAKPDATLQNLREAVLAEANDIYREDVDMCQRIGRNGEKFIKDRAGILTHCNAGALATAGQGTALSVIYEAKKKAKNFKVYVDETRPLLQGARLTAWELKHADIEAILICDNMAGWLMKQGKIDACLTGADRIAANGDTANKIGTYSLSVLAKEHNIPFYIAAPSSTFDLNIKSGAEIPIEQREAEEVTVFAKTQTAPDEICVDNPAFDVTEAQDITAIITEKGVIKRPNTDRIARHLIRGARWYNRIVIAVLIVLFGAVYLSTLLPGVSRGDSAEMQYASAFLAVCHTPGYQIEVSFGKLFSLLPIGPSIAWRVNFMMAVFGTIGCLSLYGAVRRITSFTIPAVVAATTLGFSSIYWTHCLHAEVYVFYSSFLLLGVYTIVRFVQSRNQIIWLYLTALFVGICVADRASELFVVPAFFLLWLLIRKRIRLGPNPRKESSCSLFSFIRGFYPSFYLHNDSVAYAREHRASSHKR